MKVKELLNDESKWYKGSYAVDAEGRLCHENSEAACKWCLLGAINRCYPWILEINETSNQPQQQVIDKVISAIGSNMVARYNDAPETTFEQIKTLVNNLDI